MGHNYPWLSISEHCFGQIHQPEGIDADNDNQPVEIDLQETQRAQGDRRGRGGEGLN